MRFDVPSTAPTASPVLNTGKGDAIIVWLAISDLGAVQTITDSVGDSFTQISAGGATGPYSGSSDFQIWGAFNVKGGGGTSITVTLAPSSKYVATNAAVVAYDVHGVGPAPVDQLSPVVTSYALNHGPSTLFPNSVWSGPSDLVLTGITYQKTATWTPGQGLHPIAEESETPPSGSANPTAVDTLQEPWGNSWGWAWTNATANTPVAWAGQTLTLMPSSASPTKYTVTFTETGIASGTTWQATLVSSTETAAAPSSIAFSERSGTYPFSVGAARYAATPASGTVTVGGAVTVSATFVAAPPVQHVVVIMMENENGSAVLSGAPYQRYLANNYGEASTFYSACHYSYPNYATITSGRYFACGSASIPVEGVSNLGDLLDQAGQSWMGYFESMSSPCQFASSGTYASYHNPFILYKDVRYNASRCDAHLVNSAAFNQSVAQGNLPAYSLYIPNLKDDCEESSLAFCDQWLQSFLGGMLNSTNPATQQLMSSTAFFITYDESGGADRSGYSSGGLVNSWCQQQTGHPLSVCGGRVYLAVVSPWSHGTKYTSDASLYNIQSTVEWLLGVVGNDGGWDGTAAFPAMTSLFKDPPMYAVQFDESGLSGQTWNVTLRPALGPSTTQSTNGTSMSFMESNGTYSFTVAAPAGYTASPSSGSVTVAGQPPAPVTVTFSPPTPPAPTYTVTFEETGLSGQTWSVTLVPASGPTTTLSSSASSISFQEPNGTYSYTIGAPTGYTATPASGTVTVSGQNPTPTAVVFAPVLPTPAAPSPAVRHQ